MSSTTNRRGLLGIGLGLAAVATGWQIWLGRKQPLMFEPIRALPGWRRITFDSVSGTGGSATDAIFLGINASDPVAPLSPDALCATLYPASGSGIPAAVFTDVNCPNCASLEAKLKARDDVLNIHWLDLPLLGPSSENAARAMAAGDLQKGGATFRQTILNTSPGRLMPPVLARLADQSGLNAQKLLADMKGDQVEAVLRTNRRAAETLGVWGTPGFTIGRTFVLGDMREDILDQLISQETENPAC